MFETPPLFILVYSLQNLFNQKLSGEARGISIDIIPDPIMVDSLSGELPHEFNLRGGW